MGECKTKAIQTNLGTFRHNQAYPGIIEVYSGIFRALCYHDIFETVVYQNPDIFRTRSIFTTLVYSEPPQIQSADIFKMRGSRLIIFASYNYFCESYRVDINILRYFLRW